VLITFAPVASAIGFASAEWSGCECETRMAAGLVASPVQRAVCFNESGVAGFWVRNGSMRMRVPPEDTTSKAACPSQRT
jgi:hypothetical protein